MKTTTASTADEVTENFVEREKMAKRTANTIFSDDEAIKLAKLKKALTAVVILLSVAALILLTVFLVNYLGVRHLVSEQGDGILIDRGKGITYTLVTACPYNVNIDARELYAKSDGVEYYKVGYYDGNDKVKFYDPKKIIATVDEFGNQYVYTSDDFTLPKLEELNPKRSYTYYVGIEEVEAGTLYEEDTQTLFKLLKDGSPSVLPSDIDENSTLVIRFFDPDYSYFLYSVEYFKTESGERYIRDRALGKCVKATEELKAIFGE